MINFFDWAKNNNPITKKSWLILGKGPSFSQLSNYNLNSFTLITLNHVVKYLKTDFAHLIDFDVFESCQYKIEKNAKFLVLPWKPHFNNKPSNITLKTLIKKNVVLQKLEQEKRLLWYNASSEYWDNSKPINHNHPVVPTNSFSAEAVVNLLAMIGIKDIKTLGVDGGKTYSSSFNELVDKTLLNNGRESFNYQFRKIFYTVKKYEINFSPLYVDSPISVFVGSTRQQWLAVKVLEYSILKNTNTMVEVIPLYKNGIKMPIPKNKSNQPRTPFSFQRFLIPQLKNYSGKAIYLDSDMLVFGNILEIWKIPIHNFDLFCSSSVNSTKPQFSVMLLNCERLKWNIKDIVNNLDEGKLNYNNLMGEMKIADKVEILIKPEWNSLEYYKKGKTKLLHYTKVFSQPWLFNNNPLGYLWIKELNEAVIEGYVSFSEIKYEIKKGNIKPSILYQLLFKKYSTLKSPLVNLIDLFFTPPFQKNNLKFLLNYLPNQVITVLICLLFDLGNWLKKIRRKFIKVG